MKYDCIVIGAGTAGLISALTLQKKGKKVLILEKGINPGGALSSFKRGAFEFDTNVFPMYGFGSEEKLGEKMFQQLDLQNKIKMNFENELFHIIVTETNEEYTFSKGIESFEQKMEEYVPGSMEVMETFFGLCLDVKEALEYIKTQKTTLDERDLLQKYPNFVQLAPLKVKRVFEYLNMPKKVIELLSVFCNYMGSSIKDLSFVYFANFVYTFISSGPCYPKNTSYEFVKLLEESFKEKGGVIKYHTKVNEILVDNGKVVGVQANNETFKTSHVISNVSPKMVYEHFISQENVPIECIKLENERILGPSMFTVFVGLNKTKNELGIEHTHYIITNTLDSIKEFEKLHQVFSGHLIAHVIEEQNTTQVVLTGMIYKDALKSFFTPDHYFEIKEQLEDYFVTVFENATGHFIRESIEEIDLATPVTYARYTGHPYGILFGYLAKGYDNLLPRMFCEDEENKIEGLRFCGSYGSRLSLFLDLMENANEVALKTFGECEE